MNRLMLKHVWKELQEIDYLNKLSESEVEYLLQFLMEYYQADFNFDNPIHPSEFIAECRRRNNAAKRQIESVGSDLLTEAARKARNAQYSTRLQNRYYTPEDYTTDNSLTIEDIENDTE